MHSFFVRMPDIVVGGHRFYHNFSSIRTQNLRSECNLKMYVCNLGYELPQIGAPKTTFYQWLQLHSDFNFLYLRNETSLRQVRWKLQEVCYIVSDVHKHKWLQITPAFLPTLCKFCILLRCQVSQTKFSRQNSTKLCQMVNDELR